MDYRQLVGISSNEEDENSAITESQTSYSLMEEIATIYMAGTMEDFMTRIAE